ncbi:MAG: poly-beta-1,6-N-acetyl-D-glucosamine N-deacetylase PgaB [Nitrospirota bacterium]
MYKINLNCIILRHTIILFFAFISLLNGCSSRIVDKPPAYRIYRYPPIKTEYKRLVKRFNNKDYDNAVKIAMKIIERYPGAKLLSDVQWILAVSYESRGDIESALREYNLFIRNFSNTRHISEARKRINNIQRKINKEHITHAVIIIPKRGYSYYDLEKRVLSLKDKGIDTIILQVYNNNGEGGRGVYFETNNAPVIEDILTPIIMLAHNKGIRVFVMMAIRNMGWIAMEKVYWMDRHYELKERKLKAYHRLDIFNPQVQKYILAIYKDLASYPIDGISFNDDLSYSKTEGFSIKALDQYKKDFGHKLNPLRLYKKISKDKEGGYHASSFSSDFWRWIGWKNRNILKFLNRVMNISRESNPAIKFTINLDYETIIDPKRALVDYTQDILETQRYNFNYYAINGYSLSSNKGTFKNKDILKIIKRGKELIKDTRKLLINIESLERDNNTLSISHLYSASAWSQITNSKGSGLILLSQESAGM